MKVYPVRELFLLETEQMDAAMVNHQVGCRIVFGRTADQQPTADWTEGLVVARCNAMPPFITIVVGRRR